MKNFIWGGKSSVILGMLFLSLLVSFRETRKQIKCIFSSVRKTSERERETERLTSREIKLLNPTV